MASTSSLLSSTCAVFVTDTTQYTQHVPNTVLTSSPKVDECKALVSRALTRGLHSSTIQLYLSRFLSLRPTYDVPRKELTSSRRVDE